MSSRFRSAVVRRHTLLLVAFVTYALLMSWILFVPSAAPPTATVEITHGVLMRLGLSPVLFTPERVEFALNVALFAPIPFLAALVWPRWSWERWTAFGFLASIGVETIQELLLPDRTATMRDVVANTLGALIGSVAAAVLLRTTGTDQDALDEAAARRAG